MDVLVLKTHSGDALLLTRRYREGRVLDFASGLTPVPECQVGTVLEQGMQAAEESGHGPDVPKYQEHSAASRACLELRNAGESYAHASHRVTESGDPEIHVSMRLRSSGNCPAPTGI